jgi:hypothetical protein
LPINFRVAPEFDDFNGIIGRNPAAFPKLFTTEILIGLTACQPAGTAVSGKARRETLVNNLAAIESNRPTTHQVTHFQSPDLRSIV